MSSTSLISGSAFVSSNLGSRYVSPLPSPVLPYHLTTLSMVSSQGASTKQMYRAFKGRDYDKKKRPAQQGNSQSSSRRNNSQKLHPVKKTAVPIEEASSMGEAIQMAQTIADHLDIAEKFIWLPTDDNLPSHLRTQLVHHEKRRRWGSQILYNLGLTSLNEWGNNPHEILRNISLEGDEENIWRDTRLLRMVLSVALPMKDSTDRPEKDGIWISQALKGLHMISGCIAPVAPKSEQGLEVWMNIHRGISALIQSADTLFATQDTLLKDAVEVRWAIRGLVCRLQIANNILSRDLPGRKNAETILFTTPNLNSRTSSLPFDILPHCLPWQMNPIANDTASLQYYGYPTQDLLPDLISSIPFSFDTLTTRSGNSVMERRGTAWLAEAGIGALAYSGKLMKPSIPTEIVRNVMRDIEQWCYQSENSSLSQLPSAQPIGSKLEFIWDDCTSNRLPYNELGKFIEPNTDGFFDCALCNHYPDGDSACKFHTDPEHGSHWHRVTAVVSCGQVRVFAFRPIPEISVWNDWDIIYQNAKQQKDDTTCAPATLSLFPGDVVLMTRDCNDCFHHAVYSSQSSLSNHLDSSRVSLVFKRAIDRNGKRGHGLEGEGRRSRRNLVV